MNALKQGYNDLYTWCQNNGERGQRLLDEYMEQKNFDELGKIMSEFTSQSHTKLWWKCAECGHEWQAAPHARVGVNSNCPACCKGSNIIVKGKNDLETWCHQEEDIAWGELILKEWDYEANAAEGNYINTVSYGSHKKLHWICSNEKCGKKFITCLKDRTISRSGCPHCSGSGTSYPEQFIFYSLNQIYETIENRSKQFKSKKKPQGIEYDIWIPEVNMAIEYSGDYYHGEIQETEEEKQRKLQNDKEKREKALSEGLKFIEIIETDDESKQSERENQYIILSKNANPKGLKNILRIIFPEESKHIDFIEADRQAIAHSRGKVEEDKQLQNIQPDLCKEWDYEKNELGPEYYTQGSHARISWRCLKCHESFDLIIKDRVMKKSGCPHCAYNVFEGKVNKKAEQSLASRDYKRCMKNLTIIDFI